MASDKIRLEADRLYLRPWKKNKSDAKELYRYGKDPKIGPSAGWAVHRDVAYSMEIIRNILSPAGIFAIVLRETDKPIGAVGLTYGSTGRKYLAPDEAELGYWIGAPYWGQGLAREAAQRLLRYAFEDLGMHAVWAACFDGNERSRQLQERMGFVYQRSEETFAEELGERKLEHFSKLTRDDWEVSTALRI